MFSSESADTEEFTFIINFGPEKYEITHSLFEFFYFTFNIKTLFQYKIIAKKM